MDFFENVYEILNCGDKELKFSKFAQFYENYKKSEINFTRISPPKALVTPSYASFCEYVSMRELNKKNKKCDKQKAFLHSIAHIEYCAVDIALDAAYRFDGLSREFYDDWLEVAEDEIRHFKMIEKLLNKTGVKYGEMLVHDGLFVALQKTQNSLLQRMALLPRYMEANGLDANAHIIKRLENEGEPELLETLHIILEEEVSHVSKGDKWFRYACEKSGHNTDEYINIVRNLYPNSFRTCRELNEKDRLRAGFSKEEINTIKGLAK
ncbi:MAG: ferritin-like domain-containing protein [Campylobacter sp.]|nr:ferritin-like domain-containing protein [Campylobacter sp.]